MGDASPYPLWFTPLQWLKWGARGPLLRFEPLLLMKKCSFMHKICQIPTPSTPPSPEPPAWPGHFNHYVTVSVASICPTLWGSKVPPSTPSFFLSLPPFPLPLEVGPLIQLRGLADHCKLHQLDVRLSPNRQRFWCILRVKERCWWHSRCTVSNNRKRLFLKFYEDIFQDLTCFRSVVTLLRGSKP